MADFVKPTDLEAESLRNTIAWWSADSNQRTPGMDYFNGLKREGLEAVRALMPRFVDENAWNDTPPLEEILTALDEVVASFGGSYTLHGYAKFHHQARLTVEGFEYQGSERGVGALVFKFRAADEVVIKSNRGPENESSVYVWWD
jgi:hypothetical protein